jgi:hypothetical protein
MDQPEYCETCKGWTYNVDHVCVIETFSGPPWCEECGAPTNTCQVGAPGIGSITRCENGHVDDNSRIMTIAEAI